MPVRQPLLYAPVLAYLTGAIGTILYQSTNDTAKKIKTQELKNIKALVDAQQPPKTTQTQSTNISISPWRILWDTLHDTTAEQWEQSAQKNRNPADYLMASIKHFTDKKPLAAVHNLRDALDVIDGKQPKLTGFFKLYSYNLRFAAALARNLIPHKPETYLFNATYNAIANPERAWYHSEIGRRVADHLEQDTKPDTYLFHALLASAQRRSDENHAWEDYMNCLDDITDWDWIGESRNKRWKLTGSATETVFVKGNSNRDALIHEKQSTETLDAILEDIATVPRILHITEQPYDGKYALVMRHLPGETLHEKLTRGETESIPRVLKTLAHIHARYPHDELTPENLEQKIETKLYSPELALPRDLANDILAHYKPVLRGVQDGAYWAAIKDAHPENWLDGDELGVIDSEITALGPVTFDLANLFEYQDAFTQEQKIEHVIAYASQLRKQGRELNNNELAHAYGDNTQLMRAYYNSVLHRVFCLVTAWSSPQRPRMHSERAFALTRALRAINDLNQIDPVYYSQHEQDYHILSKAIAHMRGLIPS